MVDLIVRNGMVVDPNGVIVNGGLVIDSGKIVALANDANLPTTTADRVIDAKGKAILPGVVDPESHLGSNREFRVDIETETRAAVGAGVTTLGMMQTPLSIRKPNREPESPDDIPTFSDVLGEGISVGERYGSVDFFITPLLQTYAHAREIPQIASNFGTTSYKIYLHMKNPAYSRYWHARWHGFMPFDDRMIYLAFENTAAIGPPGVICMHCENWEIASIFEERLEREGRMDLASWDDRSPHFLEAGHLRYYAYLARMAKCPLYLVHTTTPETLREAALARSEGARLTCQTAPQYLTLTKYNGWRVNVPLRDESATEALWRALASGQIDCIGSDHTAHGTRKEVAGENAWKVKGGFASRVESILPIMLSEGVKKGRISLGRLVEVCCRNTAYAFGVYPKKGALQVGSDADFVVADLNKELTLSDDMVNSRSGWTIWAGRRITGWPVMVFRHGELVAEWDEGAGKNVILPKAGTGKYLRRNLGSQTTN